MTEQQEGWHQNPEAPEELVAPDGTSSFWFKSSVLAKMNALEADKARLLKAEGLLGWLLLELGGMGIHNSMGSLAAYAFLGVKDYTELGAKRRTERSGAG